MYWIYNKITQEPAVSGSIKKAAAYTGLKESTLYNCFSRGKLEFEDDQFKIVKVKKI
jgi:hypothetical protein